MLTLHLSLTETLNYTTLRANIRATARAFEKQRGRRFAQIVAADGRIFDVLEV